MHVHLTIRNVVLRVQVRSLELRVSLQGGAFRIWGVVREHAA